MKALQLTHDQVIDNMQAVYDQATAEELSEGMGWYYLARIVAVDLASQFNTTIEAASGVLAALSPRNKWHSNVANAYTVFGAIAQGLKPEDYKVSTTNANKLKAHAIAAGAKPLAVLGGRKVLSFFDNIYDVYKSTVVTVDSWQMRLSGFDHDAPSQREYSLVEYAVQTMAADLAMRPMQLQAILWVVYRNRSTQAN